ncbi:MAG: hypothetical protein FWE06_08800 [Oscillospiraceae bacterium]|nr:hypothetical protein [Oscillospiraceae bacterium]
MKKLIVSLFAMLFFVVACSSPTPNVELDDTITPVEYVYIHSDAPIFTETEELVNVADHVFVGEVMSISFAVINSETGRAPTPDCEKGLLRLGTTYDVRVITAYKGAGREVMRIRVSGGIKGYREQEQLALIREAGAHNWDGVYYIPIEHNIAPLEVSGTYLFTVVDLVVELEGYSNFVGLLNTEQSLLDLDDPFETTDAFTDVSVKAIISEFGEGAFEEHWEHWQNDNPDWEQRMTRGNRRSRNRHLQDEQGGGDNQDDDAERKATNASAD